MTLIKCQKCMDKHHNYTFIDDDVYNELNYIH